MADVFISFSFKDQSIVEDIYNKLSNNHNLTCWMCTHEVRGGEHYKRVIRNAIAECKVFVLVQSVNSLLSEDVAKEESIAQIYKKPIIPFIIEASSPTLNADLEYDLYNTHYIDATKPTLDERITELADMIKDNIDEKIMKGEK